MVDDNESWRRLFCSTLGKESRFQVIREASDGLEAVRKVEGLQPDLILLDIGLPSLNGIEVYRRIRDICPMSRVLFVSENRSPDIAQEALNTGAGGYVVKSDAAELLPAVNAVLAGKRFISTSLAAHIRFTPAQHEVAFYSEDRYFLNDVTGFIGTALKAGNAAIVIATKPHLENLVLELRAQGLGIAAVIEEGRYIQVDASDMLSMFIVNDRPDTVRLLEFSGDLIIQARKAAKGENPRVTVFGECVNLLLSQGNSEAAIQMEKLANRLTQIHAVDMLCGYSPGSVELEMDAQTYQQICAEHSAVHSR